jgi:hypothetical protein
MQRQNLRRPPGKVDGRFQELLTKAAPCPQPTRIARRQAAGCAVFLNIRGLGTRLAEPAIRRRDAMPFDNLSATSNWLMQAASCEKLNKVSAQVSTLGYEC